MPRFTGYNASNVNNMVRAQTPGEAKSYSIPALAAFDFYANDVESPDLRTQLGSLSGVTYQEAAGAATPKMIQITNPTAKAVANVHANYAGNAVVAFPGPFTNPGVARNLRLTFAAAYDGGNVTVTGTDQFGNVITEVFVAVPATTVVGVKIFKTVTAAVRAAVGATANPVSIGDGDKLGIAANFTANGVLFANGAVDAGTWDTTNDGVVPTTLPNGTTTYLALVNV